MMIYEIKKMVRFCLVFNFVLIVTAKNVSFTGTVLKWNHLVN